MSKEIKQIKIYVEDWKFVWGLHAKRKLEGKDLNMSDTMHYLLEHSKKNLALEEEST